VSFYADAEGGILRNSLIYDNVGGPTGEGGIRISHGSRKVSIVNNTIYRNSGPGIKIYDLPLAGTRIFNNIIVANDRNVNATNDAGYALIVANDCDKRGFESDYNVVGSSTSKLIRWEGKEFGTLAAWQAAQGQDTHSIDVGALAIDEKDFFLNPPAQAIKKGLAIDSITNDFLGNTRPRGKGIDVGAVEKQ
jgi:parallel beta-helix repeat protein